MIAAGAGKILPFPCSNLTILNFFNEGSYMLLADNEGSKAIIKIREIIN